MTGNDIVDIATAAIESNWQRKNYLQKIFTPQEQQYIYNATLPEQMVWRLWSMKESAYKIYTRQYGSRFFAPQKLNCFLSCETTGQVIIHNTIYNANTISTVKYIYTVAATEESSPGLINDCFAIPQDHSNQQKFIYERVVSSYATARNDDKNSFAILKDKNNIPFLHCKTDKTNVPVSITHHGNYAAFII